MNNQILWVVEICVKNKWESTFGVAYERKSGREILREWRDRFPDDKFRLVKYVPYCHDTTQERNDG